MSIIKYRELRRRYELDGASSTIEHLSESINCGDLRPEDFSLRDLAEGLVPDGHLWVRELDPRNAGAVALSEASEGVDLTAFTNIAGKIIESKIIESYKRESFIGTRLIDTIPTRFETDRIPIVTPIDGDALEVRPGMPYPNLGFSSDYLDTPRTSKRGLIVPVTKEAIFFDRTHLVLSRAAEVGEVLGLNKEKRIFDLILGLENNYTWAGTAYNTYYKSTDTSPPWVNSMDSNELTDWTSVEKMEKMIGAIRDPYTKEPILAEPDTVLIMPQKKMAAAQIFQAANVTLASDGQSFMATVPNTFADYTVYSSRIALDRLVRKGVSSDIAQNYWFMGNFRKAFAYMENWPITVTRSSPQSDAEFSQDIVVRFKASERGAAAVLNPRYIARSIG